MPEERRTLPGQPASDLSAVPAVSARRRTVVRTAAWTIPAVSLATAAPAFAASSDLMVYADAFIYQTPTAWERVVWPAATDDSETTRIENLFIAVAENEQEPPTPVAFQLQIELPASWPAGLTVSVEPSELDGGGPALEFTHLAGASTGSGTITGRRIVVTGALRPGETSGVVNVVIDGQGPVEELAFLLSWGGKTEPYAMAMQTWAQAEHGRDAPRLLVIDPDSRSFLLKPTEAEYVAAGGDAASYPPFAADAMLTLPAVSFPASAPDPGAPRELVVEVTIEYFAPFAGPLQGSVAVAGAGSPGVLGVSLVEPVVPAGDLNFTTTGTRITWQSVAALTVGTSVGEMSLALLGGFEANGAEVTVRYLVDDEEMEEYEIVLVPWTPSGG